MKWARESIDRIPSLASYRDYIVTIENNVVENPTLCVETCKSFIEGICKTVLANRNIAVSDSVKFHALVGDTMNAVLAYDDTSRADITELGRRIAAVAHKLGEIRNNAGFASHGMDVLNPRLTGTLAQFASNITDNIVGFILSCYENNRERTPDHRIHYEDCTIFNDHFDELYPLKMGPIEISSSYALYHQDYEGYKEAYQAYLEDLTSQIEEIEP